MPRYWSGIILVGAALAVPVFALAQEGQPAAPAAPAPSSSESAAPPASTAPAVPTAPALTAPQPPIAPPPPENKKLPEGHFEFGSYGRVQFASDSRGGTGREANIVAHGDRIDEDSYAELELRREDRFSEDVTSKVVFTLALMPPFFHFSGDLTQQLVVRNLDAQGTYKNITMWVGSRMYRGDDIYLLDWWPLDNQNTLGGGVGWKEGDTTVAAHVGMTRLDDPYQYEQVPEVTPFTIGSTNVTYLDRPRIVETLKFTQLFRQKGSKAGWKAIAYGEAHELSAGVQKDIATNFDKPLPADWGFMVGAELAYWTGERDTFIQLFARHARGLAAYDPLSVPASFGPDNTTQGATETLFALGGNWEHGMFGLLGGAYIRFFRDASPGPTTLQKYDEGIVIVRPQLYFGQYFGLALEGSYQERRYAFLNPESDQPLSASAWRFGLIPYFSPSGRGSYKRPQLRIIYALTARNSGARELYPADDVFAQRSIEHYLGLGAEWWFNSSSYP